MADDLLDDRLVDVRICHHGDRGVAAAVRCPVNAQPVQQWSEKIDVIIVVGKMFAIHRVD